jgi:hypothetical protein
VEAGLQELLDREAIRTVLYTYCRAIDRVDRDLLSSVYHPDATDDHGAYSGSAAGFVDWAMQLAPTIYETMQHSIGTVLIELQGDTADAESYFVQNAVRRATEDRPRTVDVLVGRYVDRLERRDDGWRIAERVVVKDFRHQMELHDVAEDYRRSTQGFDDVVYTMRTANR